MSNFYLVTFEFWVFAKKPYKICQKELKIFNQKSKWSNKNLQMESSINIQIFRWIRIDSTPSQSHPIFWSGKWNFQKFGSWDFFIFIFSLLATMVTNTVLTLKRLVGRRGGINLTPPCRFSKNISSKERVKSSFFVTFNIILKHIFPKDFIEFPQVVQKIWKKFSVNISYFHQFSSTFWIFWH